MRTESRIILAVALALLVWAVFGTVVGHDFINMDDDQYVYDNRFIRNGLTWTDIKWAFTSLDLSFWHPITVMSHQLDVELYGLNPAGHHLTALLIHLAISLLLFIVLERSLGNAWSSFFVAALFALHPLRVEVVAWISERKELLSGFFWMTTMAAYLRYLRRPGRARYSLMLVSLCLGLMAKPMLVTLPVMLLVFDYWPYGRLRMFGAPSPGAPSPGSVVLEKIPLLFLSFGAGLLSVRAEESTASLGSGETLPLFTRLAFVPVAYAAYLWRTVVPRHLAIFYPHQGPAVPWGSVAASAALLAAVSLLVWLWRKPYATVGWLWYLITLLPVSGVIQVGSHFTADRYAYMPLIGVFLGVVRGAESLAGTWPRRRSLPAVAGGCLLLLLMVLSRIQVGYWRDSKTIFGHTLRVTRGNWQAFNNYAVALAAEGRVDEALKLLRDALPITPSGIQITRVNLGVLLARRGKLEEAVRQFREAVRIFPADWRSHYNLGVSLAEAGDDRSAAAAFSEAVRIHPFYPEALFNLGNTFTRLRTLSQAEEAYRAAIRQDPAFAEAHYNLAMLLEGEGRTGEAQTHLVEAFRLNPALLERK